MSTRLTDRGLKRLLPPYPEQVELKDSQVKGLSVRGSRRSAQWVLQRIIGGNRQRVTLGEWPATTVSAARYAANAALAAWLANGAAPTNVTINLALQQILNEWEKAHSHWRATTKRKRDVERVLADPPVYS